MATFTPPVDRLPLAPPFERWKYDRGRTVYRAGGAWVETTNPPWDTLAAADALPAGDTSESSVPGRYAFLGGYQFTVSAAVAAELQAAGYVTT
jgi:hypothetical protein